VSLDELVAIPRSASTAVGRAEPRSGWWPCRWEGGGPPQSRPCRQLV